MKTEKPKMGRPTEDPKNRGYRIRMSDNDLEKLNFTASILGLSKAEVIRQGIDQMYEKAKKEEKK